MAVLIDTSILIARERSERDLTLDTLEVRPDEPVFMSVISASELLHGVARANTAAVRSRRSAFVEKCLAAITLIPIDLAVARVHAELWAELAAQGKMIGSHDLWLAATCLAHDLEMLTLNVREFRTVQGLTLRTPSLES